MAIQWRGSAKDVSYHPEQGLILDFSNRVSVFDIGPVPADFLGLGELRCAIATHLFEKFHIADIYTHFRRRNGPTQMVVEPFDIPERGVRFEEARGRQLPFELLFRFGVTEKFYNRIVRGEVSRAGVEQFLRGMNRIEPGVRLSPAFVECSTKHQDADDYVSDRRAAALANISVATLWRIYTRIHPAAGYLKVLFRDAGFDLMDGKFEVAFLPNDEPIIIDSISPDELRLIGPDGQSYDKDPVRKWYAETYPDWVAELNRAKKRYPNDKSQWPEYPGSPSEEIIRETVRRYRVVAEAIGAI